MTKQMIHTSPLGALEIAGVLGRPEPGEPFEIDDDLAEALLEQTDLYQVYVPLAERGVDELRDLAGQRGIDTKGLKKTDLIAALTPATDDEEASK